MSVKGIKSRIAAEVYERLRDTRPSYDPTAPIPSGSRIAKHVREVYLRLCPKETVIQL